MKPLSLADLVELAAAVLGCPPADVLAELDTERAEHAVRVATASGGDASQVGALFHALLTRPPINRGARRLAVMAAAEWAERRGRRLDLHPPQQVRDFVAEIAAGDVEPEKVVAWVADRLGRRWASPRISLITATTPEEASMFERFTDRARRSVAEAKEEAARLGHCYIGTEHLLLGVTQVTGGLAVRVLQQLGTPGEAVRAAVEERVTAGEGGCRHVPFTPNAKRVMETALQEALKLGHNYIGTEHLLLALVRVPDGIAPAVLADLGVTYEAARQAVVEQLSGFRPDPGRAPTTAPAEMPRCAGCRAAFPGALRLQDTTVHERSVSLLYCAACGRTVGALPAAG